METYSIQRTIIIKVASQLGDQWIIPASFIVSADLLSFNLYPFDN